MGLIGAARRFGPCGNARARTCTVERARQRETARQRRAAKDRDEGQASWSHILEALVQGGHRGTSVPSERTSTGRSGPSSIVPRPSERTGRSPCALSRDPHVTVPGADEHRSNSSSTSGSGVSCGRVHAPIRTRPSSAPLAVPTLTTDRASSPWFAPEEDRRSPPRFPSKNRTAAATCPGASWWAAAAPSRAS